jgi:hypothetical protein
MDDLIFDRLAALRAAAEARAQRIHDRSVALEARRRDFHARMDAMRQLTMSPAPAVAAEGRADAVSAAA